MLPCKKTMKYNSGFFKAKQNEFKTVYKFLSEINPNKYSKNI